MAYKHITAATTTVVSGPCSKVRVVVNTPPTGTITIYDDVAGGTTTVVAIITNPAVGNSFEYVNFANGVQVVTSATGDITVNTDGSYSRLS